MSGRLFSVGLFWEVRKDGDALAIYFILWMVPVSFIMGFIVVVFTSNLVDVLPRSVMSYDIHLSARTEFSENFAPRVRSVFKDVTQ